MDHRYHEKSAVQKRYYDETAKDYDRWHTETPSAKVVDQWNFDALKRFTGGRVGRCLELGSGTGRLANNLLAIADEVHGVDLSEEVLAIARRKYPQLTLIRGEVVALPYPDGMFDLVVINGSLHHFFAMERTFAEAFRVLKPGGAFILLGEPNRTYFRWYNPFFAAWVATRIASRLLRMMRPAAPVENIEPEAETFSRTQLRRGLAAAGFAVQDVTTYDFFGRSDAPWFVRGYRRRLDIERRTLGRAFPALGMVLQAFARKPAR